MKGLCFDNDINQRTLWHKLTKSVLKIRLMLQMSTLLKHRNADDYFRSLSSMTNQTTISPRLSFLQTCQLYYIWLTFPAGWGKKKKRKKKSTLTLSHMSLSSRSCAFWRLTNIVSFVSKIYSRLPIRINMIKFRVRYATTR